MTAAFLGAWLAAFSPRTAQAAGGAIVVAHSGDAPPYFFRGEGGRPAGLLADYWRLAGKAGGADIRLRLAPDAAAQVASGRADVLAGVVRPAAPDARFLFSRPFLDLGIGMYAPRLRRGQASPLEGRGVIGLLAADPSASFLAAAFPRLRQRTYPDARSLAAALAVGQVQVAAGPVLQLRYFLDRLGGPERFVLLRRFPGPQLCAAVPRGKAALLARINAALDKVGLNEMARLEKRWGGAAPRRNVPLWMPAAILGSALALGLALALFLRARRLRADAAVRLREVELLRENLMGEMARHKKTQELFAAAIEQSPSGIIIAFPGGDPPPLLNRQALRLLRLREAPPLDGLLHGGGRILYSRTGRRISRDDTPIARVLVRGESLRDAEYRMVESDGAERWILCNAAPILAQDGTRRAAVFVFHDVTVSRRAAHDLARFKALLDAGAEEVFLIRPDGALAYVNEAAACSLGYPREELVGRMMGEFDPCFRTEALGEFLRSVRVGPRTLETTQLTQSGLCRIKELKAFYMRFGEEEFICGFGQDITERKRMQEDLERTRALFAAALEQTSTGIVIGDAATLRASIFNPAARSMLGLPAGLDAPVGDAPEKWRLLRPDGSPYPTEGSPLRRSMSEGLETENLEVLLEVPRQQPRWLLVNASPIRDAAGAVTAGIMAMTDITGRKQMERQLLFKAQHDALTGLPNREFCLERIGGMLGRTVGEGALFLVAIADLDRFKMLNDSLGHAFGDQVLTKVARRLVSGLAGRGSVCRFGGDEFVLVVEEAGDAEEAQDLVREVMASLRRPMGVDGLEVRLTASVGVVVGPTADCPTADSVLQNADLAMHWAKDSGRDRIRLFHPGMLRRAVELLSLDADMRRGLEREEFVPFFQPVMNLENDAMIGMEALVRWQSPKRGLVPPGSFIPHAEDSGIILELGEQILRRACAAMADWRARFPAAGELSLAVNLSARQFTQPDIVERVREALARTGMPPEQLKLELTESTLMRDPESALAAMRRLKALGVSLAIDDFGTGYSSLAYLQRFPVDILKIDRAFVRDLPRGDADSLALVRAILALADSLHMDVVAEGVESREQADILAGLGCRTVQGFLFHAPLPAAELEDLLGPERGRAEADVPRSPRAERVSQ